MIARFLNIFQWMVGTFSVTTNSTSFLWMDNRHFFYILSLWMIFCRHFFCIFQWTITTFPTSSCLWVTATHSAKKKSKHAGLAQQNGFSPAYLHRLLAEVGKRHGKP
jgi:hypothetical protein